MKPIQGWDEISHLYSEFKDTRKKENKVAIFCPVGDSELLKTFLDYMRKQSFQSFDLILIYKKDVPFQKCDDLSILHLREKFSFGTSGNFFMGQYIAYKVGYEIIIIADIDAIPSSNNLLQVLIENARATDKVVVPLLKTHSLPEESNQFSVNGYGTYPKSIFEKYGFITPYYFRGAEDYEMIKRLQYHNSLHVCKDVFIIHPRTGHTLFHKATDINKYYSYFSSLIKSCLLLYKYTHKLEHISKFLFWYNYYYFFSNVFFDDDMKRAVINSTRWKPFTTTTSPSKFSIIRPALTNEKPHPYNLFNAIFIVNFYAIADFIAKGKTKIDDDIIIFNGNRISLIIGMITATLFIPIGFIKSIIDAFKFVNSSNWPVYPVYPTNALDAIEFCEKHF